MSREAARSVNPALTGADSRSTGVILGVLGFAALTQPLSNSTGWLFITQDRTASMRRWSAVGTAIAVVVKPRGTHARAEVHDSCLLGDVLDRNACRLSEDLEGPEGTNCVHAKMGC